MDEIIKRGCFIRKREIIPEMGKITGKDG